MATYERLDFFGRKGRLPFFGEKEFRPGRRTIRAESRSAEILKKQQEAQATQRSNTESQRRASVRRANIQGAAQAAAVGIRTGQAVSASTRLLSEFNRERDLKEDLRRRQGAQAVGQKEAAFGASGIKSVGAGQEVARQSTLVGNIQASQGNTRREGILNQARQAISGQIAAGVGIAGNVAAASQFGRLFQQNLRKRDVGRLDGTLTTFF